MATPVPTDPIVFEAEPMDPVPDPESQPRPGEQGGDGG